MRIKLTENAVTGLQTLFSSWFSPLGASVLGLMIQKSSRRFSRSLRLSSVTFDISLICSMTENFAFFNELMAMYFKMTACWNHFPVIDIFLVII